MIAPNAITEEWQDQGAFFDPDGKFIRCYDDVVVTRPIEIKDSRIGEEVMALPAGSIGTVLMLTAGPEGWAHLEMYFGERRFGFGYEKIAFLRLHMTNEEKYPR
jgi:hypothetical protein